MRSADRGNMEAGGGKQPPHNSGNSIFAPKIFCPRGKNANYTSWETGRTQVNHTSHVFHSFTTGCHVIEG